MTHSRRPAAAALVGVALAALCILPAQSATALEIDIDLDGVLSGLLPADPAVSPEPTTPPTEEPTPTTPPTETQPPIDDGGGASGGDSGGGTDAGGGTETPPVVETPVAPAPPAPAPVVQAPVVAAPTTPVVRSTGGQLRPAPQASAAAPAAAAAAAPASAGPTLPAFTPAESVPASSAVGDLDTLAVERQALADLPDASDAGERFLSIVVTTLIAVALAFGALALVTRLRARPRR